MSSLIRWEPFEELISLREAMDRLFEESFVRPWSLWPSLWEGTVPVDMYETEDSVVVTAAVPGVKPEDIDITVTGDTLTIKGEVKAEKELEKANYICRERRYGTFSRSVSLPAGLETDKAEATFENGILRLTIPKAEHAKPKTIKVKVKK